MFPTLAWMTGGWCILVAILAFGVKRPDGRHLAAAAVVATVWFALCLGFTS